LTVAKRLYIDTSAYLCVLLGESGHKLLLKEMAGAELLSSVLLVLEATRNLVRLSRDRLLSPAELHACLAQLERDRDLLAHLRTALWFHERAPLARFLTLDETQAAAAREAGLPV
jgi:predicted nucleic acid-binding protein